MKRFPSLGYCSPQELAKSSTSHNRANQINTYFFLKKNRKKKTRRKETLPREVTDTMTVFRIRELLNLTMSLLAT